MDEQTRANLLQAMHEEAFARAKFLLFASNAEAAGQTAETVIRKLVDSVPAHDAGVAASRLEKVLK